MLQIFHKMVQQDRIENQGEMRHFMGGPMININVRRNYLYEDAFEKLSVQNGLCTLRFCLKIGDFFCTEHGGNLATSIKNFQR